MVDVDVVIVSYNSRDDLTDCVGSLVGLDGVRVFVVDNASPDDSLAAVRELDVHAIQLDTNGGFAHACNVGWRAGDAELVLFLNPDARIGGDGVEALAAVLEVSAAVGAAAPSIRHADGSIDYSQRRFPRLRSTYAQALFLHRLFPAADWTDELVRDPRAYERDGSPDWVSGAAIMVRRALLERLGGWDEGFFMYAEDIDLCRRIRDLGDDVRFVASAAMTHEGGGSAPRASLLPVLAASRIRYAAKHRSWLVAMLERLGVALGALTHVVVVRGGVAARAGHARALAVALSGRTRQA